MGNSLSTRSNGEISSTKAGTRRENVILFKAFVIGNEVYGEHRPKLNSSAHKDDLDYYKKEGYQAPANQTNPQSSKLLFRDQIQAALQSGSNSVLDFFVSGEGCQEEMVIKTQK